MTSTPRPADSLSFNDWIQSMAAQNIAIASRCLSCGEHPHDCKCNTDNDEKESGTHDQIGGQIHSGHI